MQKNTKIRLWRLGFGDLGGSRVGLVGACLVLLCTAAPVFIRLSRAGGGTFAPFLRQGGGLVVPGLGGSWVPYYWAECWTVGGWMGGGSIMERFSGRTVADSAVVCL